MDKKTDDIFKFLQDNREYNHKLQEKAYQSAILRHEKGMKVDKVISMLYGVANTQSQPKIDKLSQFYRLIYENIHSLESFDSFVKLVRPNSKPTYENLYTGLEAQPGWGIKTAALFAKSIYHVHNGNYDKRLKLWSDAPKTIKRDDRLFLPVDRVMLEVFGKLDRRKWSALSVSNYINNKYNGEDMEVWDDLWFWGFITQRVENKKRKFEWNPNKYWALEFSDKSPQVIQEIEKRAKNFLGLLEED